MAQKDAFSHLRRGRVERYIHQPRQPCRNTISLFFLGFSKKLCLYFRACLGKDDRFYRRRSASEVERGAKGGAFRTKCRANRKRHDADTTETHPDAALKRLQENGRFFEFSLCLSRACLGKKIVLMYKWRKKRPFSYLTRRGERQGSVDDHHLRKKRRGFLNGFCAMRFPEPVLVK
jgi:hypothetical protein